MAASRTQIDRLRRLCGGTALDRDDSQLAEVIERYPLPDERAQAPYTWDTSTEPPTQTANDNWIPTYDLNAAAADVWEELAQAYVGKFDFATNDQTFNRSQAYDQAMKQVRHFRSKRAPVSIKMFGTSKSDSGYKPGYIINLPEEDLS